MANGGSVSVDPRTYYQYQYPSLLNQICYWIYSASARLRRLRPLRSSTRLRPSTMAAEESKAQKAASAGGGKGKKKVLTNLPTLPARFSAPAPAARCACCRLPREPPARGWTSGRRTRGSGGVLAGSPRSSEPLNTNRQLRRLHESQHEKSTRFAGFISAFERCTPFAGICLHGMPACTLT